MSGGYKRPRREISITTAELHARALRDAKKPLAAQINGGADIASTFQVGNNGTSGFGLTGGATAVAEVDIAVPADMNIAYIMAFGSITAFDDVSGGVDYLSAVVTIDGVGGVLMRGAKDAGNSLAVVNVVQASNAVGINITGQTVIPIILTAAPSNPSSFAANGGNYSSLSVFAAFTP